MAASLPPFVVWVQHWSVIFMSLGQDKVVIKLLGATTEDAIYMCVNRAKVNVPSKAPGQVSAMGYGG